jgi:TfoX/Sxy family transcriptional regulator of competence genes
MPDAEELFDRVVRTFTEDPEVEPPRPGGAFGASALKVRGKIFAMVSQGSLVVKLPSQRVQELIAAGDGAPFDAGKGRPMKEWVQIDPARSRSWTQLAREARTFVGLR